MQTVHCWFSCDLMPQGQHPQTIKCHTTAKYWELKCLGKGMAPGTDGNVAFWNGDNQLIKLGPGAQAIFRKVRKTAASNSTGHCLYSTSRLQAKK